MNLTEWAKASASRFHVIAGRDELVSGSNDLATAENVGLSISAGRHAAVMISDTQDHTRYLRLYDGRRVETIGVFA